MKFNILFAITILFVITVSCTLEETDYEAEIATEVTDYYDFEEATSFTSNQYIITIEALNGSLHKGYNEIRLEITNTQTNEHINNSEVTFLPILTDASGNNSSCPHSYELVYNTDENYYSGYAVFTNKSGDIGSWELYISFTDNDQTYTVNQNISVLEQTNKNLNMASFIGNDDEMYFIALIAPQKPNVSENNLVAGVYKYIQPTNPAGDFPDPSQFLFSKVKNHKLLLDPRMPEPSMGNHSSPNNQDLIQLNDGLYHGVVNYTMTGNWTLNFIFLNENDQVIKGTEVPTDFTPGIEGVKSELYIDTLF